MQRCIFVSVVLALRTGLFGSTSTPAAGGLNPIPPYTEAEVEQRLDHVLRRGARALSLILDRDRTADAEPDPAAQAARRRVRRCVSVDQR
jgi:hypothetical protein